MAKYFTKVAGVSHDNEDGSSRQYAIRKFCKSGASLTLKREPANKHDKTAISVWIHGKNLFRNGDFQIGYIPSQLSAELAPRMDAGWTVTAAVKEVTGGGDLTYGCNIEITTEYSEQKD
jgi:hypothetical protein